MSVEPSLAGSFYTRRQCGDCRILRVGVWSIARDMSSGRIGTRASSRVAGGGKSVSGRSSGFEAPAGTNIGVWLRHLTLMPEQFRLTNQAVQFSVLLQYEVYAGHALAELTKGRPGRANAPLTSAVLFVRYSGGEVSADGRLRVVKLGVVALEVCSLLGFGRVLHGCHGRAGSSR